MTLTHNLPDVSKYQGSPTRAPDPAFSQDLVAALAELRNPLADQRADVPTKTGGRYSYRYAALPDILDQVRSVLARYHLALLQSVVQTAPGTIGILTRLHHSSGTYQEFGPLVLPAAGDAQAVGSAITYARRYALCTVLGIAADEDSDAKLPVGESRASDKAFTLPPSEGPEAGTDSASTSAEPASPTSSASQRRRESTVRTERWDAGPSSGPEPHEPEGAVGSGPDASSGAGGVKGKASPAPEPSSGTGGPDRSGEPVSPAPGPEASHEDLLTYGLKLVGSKEHRLRGYVNTFCKTRYTQKNFDEVTSTQLRQTISGLHTLLETGSTASDLSRG